MAVALLVFAYALLALLRRSRFGHALAGIRVNEQRMRAVGFNTYLCKLAAFVLAGMLAALAGFLMAVKNGGVNPEYLSWHESGAVLGAIAFVLLKELYSSSALMGALAERWQLTLGLTMIAFVALLPDGLIGAGRRLKQLMGGAQ
jgi:branched-chain amino acid transport system permease protein